MQLGLHLWGSRNSHFTPDWYTIAGRDTLMKTESAPARPSWLENLGLHRSELRAWAMYDWANSAFITIVITTIFSPFFASVAAKNLPEGQPASLFALITYVAIAISAVLSLLLGAVADALGAQKRLLLGLTAIGAIATCAMWFIGPGDWLLASGLFIAANIAITCAFVCYNALLPHIAKPDEIDRVSSGGFAMGYLGGGIALAIVLVLLAAIKETLVAIHLAFVLAGVWWFMFALPVFFAVREIPPAGSLTPAQAVRNMFRMLLHTLKDLKNRPQIMLFLAAFLLYSDGINTIIRMAALFGAEVGVPAKTMIAAILLTQVVGVPFAFLFGILSKRFQTKTLILFGICVYTGIALVGYGMSKPAHFVVLAILVGTVQGGTQALSRSLYARMIPAQRSGEYFSVYGIMDRFSGAMGSGLLFIFGYFFGSSRLGVLGVAAMFVIGGLLLWKVNLKAAAAAKGD